MTIVIVQQTDKYQGLRTWETAYHSMVRAEREVNDYLKEMRNGEGEGWTYSERNNRGVWVKGEDFIRIMEIPVF